MKHAQGDREEPLISSDEENVPRTPSPLDLSDPCLHRRHRYHQTPTGGRAQTPGLPISSPDAPPSFSQLSPTDRNATRRLCSAAAASRNCNVGCCLQDAQRLIVDETPSPKKGESESVECEPEKKKKKAVECEPEKKKKKPPCCRALYVSPTSNWTEDDPCRTPFTAMLRVSQK